MLEHRGNQPVLCPRNRTRGEPGGVRQLHG